MFRASVKENIVNTNVYNKLDSQTGASANRPSALFQQVRSPASPVDQSATRVVDNVLEYRRELRVVAHGSKVRDRTAGAFPSYAVGAARFVYPNRAYKASTTL
jgi:hypothetical protein